MPGRKARPTAIEERLGRPKHQKINRKEPKPVLVVGEVPPPDCLDGDAQDEWRRVVPELAKLGLVSNLDLPALTTFCQSYSDFCRLSRDINKHGVTYEIFDEEGNVVAVKARPEWYLRRTAFLQLIRVATEFGMTPSSRGRMVVDVSPLTPKQELLKALDGDSATLQ